MKDFIMGNYVIFMLIISFLVFLHSHTKIGTKDVTSFKIVLLLVFILVIVDGAEYYYSLLDYPTTERYIFMIAGYTLRPLIALFFINVLIDNKKIIKVLSIPAIINFLIYCTSFFTDIVFTLDETNEFIRGQFGYTAHIVSYFYVLILIIKAIKNNDKTESFYLFFIGISSIIASLLETLGYAQNLLNISILIGLLFFYLHLYVQFAKRDVLTDLLNRQSFYEDMDVLNKKITGVMSIDMNGLKQINDTLGHDQGDKALIVVANVLMNLNNNNYRFYRIGGDEFTALCINQKKKQIEEMKNTIKDEMKELEYSCSIGYAYKRKDETMLELYRIADKKMYKEKEKFYSLNKNNRRKKR